MRPKLLNIPLSNFEIKKWNQAFENPVFLQLLRMLIALAHEHDNLETRDTLLAIIDNLNNIKAYISDDITEEDEQNNSNLREEIINYLNIWGIGVYEQQDEGK